MLIEKQLIAAFAVMVSTVNKILLKVHAQKMPNDVEMLSGTVPEAKFETPQARPVAQPTLPAPSHDQAESELRALATLQRERIDSIEAAEPSRGT